MTSHTWTYVAYGLVFLLVALSAFIVLMMRAASKREKSERRGLPQLAVESAPDEDVYIFSDEDDDHKPEEKAKSQKVPRSKGTEKKHSFFSKKQGSIPDVEPENKFFDHEDFDLADGSDDMKTNNLV